MTFLGDDYDPLYSQRLRENDPIRKLNRYIEGGPGSGPHKSGGFTTFYHGTHPEVAEKILKDGLRSGKAKGETISARGTVYLSSTPGNAKDWGEKSITPSHRERPAVLRIRIPDKIASQVSQDTRGAAGTTKNDYVFKGTIPSKYISIEDPGKKAGDRDIYGMPIRKRKRESFRERLASFGESVLREGGSGSGNFGHSGRPGEVGGAGPGGGEAPPAAPKKERKKGYKIGEKYGLVGMKPGFKVELAKEMFGGRHYKELRYAEKQMVKEALRARGIIRPKGSTEASANEKALREAAVVSKKFLGGGIEDTSKVNLEGGLVGVFKVSGGGASKESEVASWEVAKLVGLEDIHPPTVFRTIDGQKGSMQQFWQGQLASKFPGYKSPEMFDGDKDLARAAAFDYIIGNSDRHANNWLVDKGNNKLQLIDHGRTFPSREYRVANAHHTMFVRELAARESDNYANDRGKPAMSPREAAKPFVEKKEQILKALKETGIPEAAVKWVDFRIDRLARKDKWDEL